MKKLALIALVALIGCNKQKTEPKTVTKSNPIVVPTATTRTVTIYSKAYAGNGYVIVNWGNSSDSTYIYSLTQYLTRVIQSDSISLDFYCKAFE